MATRGGAIRRMGSSLNDRELDELVPAYNNLRSARNSRLSLAESIGFLTDPTFFCRALRPMRRCCSGKTKSPARKTSQGEMLK